MSTNTANPLYAVIAALASAQSAGLGSQDLGISDLSTSEFMRQFGSRIAEMHGNMAAIEATIQNYLEAHQIGSSARNNLSGGSVLAMGSLSDMLTELKANDKKLAEIQAKIEGKNKERDKLAGDMKGVLDDLGIDMMDFLTGKVDLSSTGSLLGTFAKAYGKWLGHYLAQGGFFWVPGAMAAAAAKVASLVGDARSIGAQMKGLQEEIDVLNNQVVNIQKAQLQLVDGNTGSMSVKSEQMSTDARATLTTVTQILTLSFMFLSAIEKRVA